MHSIYSKTKEAYVYVFVIWCVTKRINRMSNLHNRTDQKKWKMKRWKKWRNFQIIFFTNGLLHVYISIKNMVSSKNCHTSYERHQLSYLIHIFLLIDPYSQNKSKSAVKSIKWIYNLNKQFFCNGANKIRYWEGAAKQSIDIVAKSCQING